LYLHRMFGVSVSIYMILYNHQQQKYM